MSPTRVLRGFTFGGLGGILAWILVEYLPLAYPFQPRLYDHAQSPGVTPEQMGLMGLALGLAIGGFLGISEGMAEGTTTRFFRATFTFLVMGALGGFIGLYFGQSLFSALGGRIGQSRSEGEFLYQIIVRSVSWALMGLFLGVVYGLPNLSARRALNGAIGGFLGGLLGGFFFQTLTSGTLIAGTQGRLLGWAMVGACIGFFISLISEALKRVWVKVLIGRNEGREYVIDQPLAYTGRDELVDIPVFLDPAVPKRMASFRMTSGRYALHPESGDLPIMVNGQPLTPGQVLRDGDAIQFGRVTLGYFEKATATGGSRRPVDLVPLADYGSQPGAGAAIPNAKGICQFCGVPFDRATGACACTVPAGPPAAGGFDPQPAFAPAGYGAPDPYGGQCAPMPGGDPYAAPADFGAPAYGAPVGAAQLVALAGPYAGHSFPLVSAEVGVGRDPSQEVSLSGDSSVSRRHARIIGTPGGFVVRDEGSSNGTWVNGVRIQEQPLFPGDTLRIGHSEFRLEA